MAPCRQRGEKGGESLEGDTGRGGMWVPGTHFFYVGE